MIQYGFEVSIYIDAKDENEAYEKLVNELDNCSDIKEYKEHYCDGGFCINNCNKAKIEYKIKKSMYGDKKYEK